MDVLGHFGFHHFKQKKSISSSAKQVAANLKTFWRKLKIDTQQTHTIKKKFLKLFDSSKV